MNTLNVPGYSRLNQILAPDGPFPISRSSWWEGVKSGRFPAPVKLSSRITAWKNADLLALMAALEGVDDE